MHRKGYGRIQMNGKKHFAHRASWRAFHGEIPDGLFVLHKCDVRCCVNPEHLFLGTNSDNMLDAYAKGRIDRSGERNINAKLTVQDVLDILDAASKGVRVIELAKKYSMLPWGIRRVISRENWRHV